ncbi:hypothetical protein [Paraburkholderia sp. GAS448]|uniref:hypothetical protein n=1 Tax=Paraburkholderia sp. GAS448 TaxID=3035136 RepID=UPI003D1CDF9F
MNCAGSGSPSRGHLLGISPEAFDTVVDVNIRGTFSMSQAVARHMATTHSDHPLGKGSLLPRTRSATFRASGFNREMRLARRSPHT